MRPLHQGATAIGAVALAATLAGTTVSAQEPRPDRLGDSIERTIEAFASLVEHNAERWAKAFEKNAERWAKDLERHAERWAEDIERHAERIAVVVEIEAADQSERQREIQREAQERAREQREEALERAREQREEAQERAREQREEAQERAREARERQRDQGRNGRWREATEQMNRTVRLGRTGIVDIETTSGDITITGGNGTDVQIEARKTVRASDEARARELLPEVRVEINERPGRVEVRTLYPNLRNFGVEVDFVVTVPNGTDVFVKTMSGDVRVTNVRGELQAETMSGDVTLAGTSRVRQAKTMSGDVEISDSEGEVTAGTMSGDVTVRNVRGRSLSVSTVSGDMVLTDVDVERATAGSTSGNVDYSGRLRKGGRYELSTHAGDVRLTPVGTQGFDVEARTFNGDIESQYQMTVTRDSAAGTGRGMGFGAGRNVNRTFRGTFGDAGAFVSLQSFNGDITIVRR